jgi:ribosomal-protein-alanine N-acetyltransferase
MYTPPSTPPELATQRLILRMGMADDIPAIVSFYTVNREFLKPFEPVRPADFYHAAEWEKRVVHDREHFSKDRAMRLFLFPQDDPARIIGSAHYSVFNRGAAHHCYLGYALAEAAQGKGYMVEALKAANHYVFTVLNLHRIMANYMPRNQRSGSLLKRLGFTVEGHARDYIQINGQWEDHLLTSLTNPAWKTPD